MTLHQTDREAALKLYGWRNEEQLIREGTTAERFEVDEATQAFAAHREAERARIVAWLRSEREEIGRWLLDDGTRLDYEKQEAADREHPLWWAADIILRGDFKEPGE